MKSQRAFIGNFNSKYIFTYLLYFLKTTGSSRLTHSHGVSVHTQEDMASDWDFSLQCQIARAGAQLHTARRMASRQGLGRLGVDRNYLSTCHRSLHINGEHTGPGARQEHLVKLPKSMPERNSSLKASHQVRETQSKGCMLYDSRYIKCPEYANSERQKICSQLPGSVGMGSGENGESNEYEVSFQDD